MTEDRVAPKKTWPIMSSRQARAMSGAIILVGGGTGGHIFPTIAVGEELESRHQPFIYIGGTSQLEQEIFKNLGWSYRAIKTGKLRRYFNLVSLIQNITDLGRFIVGFFQAGKIIIKTRSKVVFSKGGPVALPVVLAAKLLGCRISIHESDAVMGLANRISAGLADRIFTNFPTSVYPGADQRYLQVGIPIRRVLIQAAKLKSPQKSGALILILGGSQGSSSINSYVRSSLTDLIKLGDIVHVTGPSELKLHQRKKAELPSQEQNSYKPFGFLNRELAYYFQLADLVVTRASATVIAEAALFNKAVYLIPLPTSAGNHQVINAEILEKAGAAVVGQEQVMTPSQFITDLTELLADQKKRDQLSSNLNQYFSSDQAASRIVDELVKNG